jgi:hypothetical protein
VRCRVELDAYRAAEQVHVAGDRADRAGLAHRAVARLRRTRARTLEVAVTQQLAVVHRLPRVATEAVDELQKGGRPVAQRSALGRWARQLDRRGQQRGVQRLQRRGAAGEPQGDTARVRAAAPRTAMEVVVHLQGDPRAGGHRTPTSFPKTCSPAPGAHADNHGACRGH